MTQASHPAPVAMPSHASNDSVVHLMVVACFTAGAIQLMSSGQSWVLWLSVTTLTIVAFGSLIRLMAVPTYATSWAVYATSLGLGYGFGAFNTMLRGYTEPKNLLQVTYADIQHVGMAEGAALLIVALLLLASTLDRKKLLPTTLYNPVERRAALIILAMSAVSVVAAIATGNLGYAGGQGSEEGSGRVSVIGSLLASTMTATLGSTVFAFAHEKDKRTRLIIFGLSIILLGALMIQGRRIFLYAMVVSMMGFFAARGTKNFFTRKTVIILLIVASTLAVTSRFYFAMRLAGYKLGPNPTLVELLEGGMDVVLNAESEGLDDANAENQATRTFIIAYLAELLQAGEKHQAVGGDLLVLNVASAVPTVIWPGKWKVMGNGGSEENICHPAFGLPPWDAANTTLTAGLCDFWWPGLVLYPLMVAALYALVNRLFRFTPLVVRTLVCFATVENLFMVENAMNAYLVGIRNITTLAAFAWGVILALQFLDKLPLVQHHREQKALRQQRLAELRKGVT